MPITQTNSSFLSSSPVMPQFLPAKLVICMTLLSLVILGGAIDRRAWLQICSLVRIVVADNQTKTRQVKSCSYYSASNMDLSYERSHDVGEHSFEGASKII